MDMKNRNKIYLFFVLEFCEFLVHVVMVDIMELVLNRSVLLSYTLFRQYYIISRKLLI